MYIQFTVVLLCSVAFAKEPHCSKFSYDEALLEKMIRTEFSFERLQTEFAELRKEVKSMLDNITVSLKATQEESVRRNTEFKNLNQSAHTVIAGLLKDTLNMLMDKEKRIDEMSGELTAFYTHIKEKESTSPIAFKATDSRDRNVAVGDVLDFSHVLFNLGDAYDSKTGIFTAPMKGLYIFTAQMCTRVDKYFSGKIVIDGRELTRFMAGDISWNVCNTGDAIATMEVGQRAYIQVLNDAIISHNIHRLSSFSCSLISKLD